MCLSSRRTQSRIFSTGIDPTKKQSGLGYRFLDEIEKSMARIVQNLFQYQEVELDIRRAVVQIFPYLMFYTFRRDSVNVLVVIHGAQDPAYIKSRFGA